MSLAQTIVHFDPLHCLDHDIQTESLLTELRVGFNYLAVTDIDLFAKNKKSVNVSMIGMDS